MDSPANSDWHKTPIEDLQKKYGTFELPPAGERKSCCVVKIKGLKGMAKERVPGLQKLHGSNERKYTVK